MIAPQMQGYVDEHCTGLEQSVKETLRVNVSR